MGGERGRNDNGGKSRGAEGTPRVGSHPTSEIMKNTRIVELI